MTHEPLRPSAFFAVVVNDDLIQLSLLAELVSRAGLEPHTFAGAEEALAAMKAGAPPDLIVTDLYMPGLDGWRFCRLLRSPEYAAFNRVPILVVSATFAGGEADRIAADLGAEAFLPSPVDAKRFIEQVRAILSGRQARNLPRVLIVEDIKTQADFIRKAFEAHGYEADTAPTVRAGAEAFKNTAYDVAVLDYHLPDGDGDVLLDDFRATKPGCVCLMMTTDPGPELALDWMKRGAAAYLRKPFEAGYLIELCARARRERALLHAQDLLEVRTRELRESEELSRQKTTLLKSIMESPQGIIIFSLDGAYRYTEFTVSHKETIKKIWGAEIEVGMNMLDVIGDPGDREKAKRNFDRALQGESLLMVEEYGDISRHRAYYENRYSPIFDLSGSVSGLTVFVIDITERKQSERILQDIIDENPISIQIVDKDGFTLKVNPAHTRLFGSVPPPNYSVFTDVQLKQQGVGALLESAKNGETIHFPDLHYNAHDLDSKLSDVSVWIRVVVFPLKDNHGKPERYVFMHENVTERKRAEVEREKLQAQLNQAQKMESVGRLAGGVAHDFNNMLGVILGHADLAMEQVDPSQPIHVDLQEIRKAADRSASLTRQLLAFARKQTIAPRVLDLNETVESMLKMLGRLIGEDIVLAWLPGARMWPVKMDPSQIDQILANLCVNARDALAGVGAGQVTIETGTTAFDKAYCAAHAGFIPGEYVMLAVRDNGRGMDKETREHLFEPFFTTKGVGQGTGLGLATVYGAVKQNNGFIDVYSEPGQGTTFKIYLPRQQGKAGQMRKEYPAKPAAHGMETILLVEDEMAILNVERTMLEKLGYRVLTASTPGEARRMAREYTNGIHLLMTDVVMPEMNGRDLANILLKLHPNLKCLFTSGYTADVIAHHGILDKGVRFIQKPFSVEGLAAKVRATIDSADEG